MNVVAKAPTGEDMVALMSQTLEGLSDILCWLNKGHAEATTEAAKAKIAADREAVKVAFRLAMEVSDTHMPEYPF